MLAGWWAGPGLKLLTRWEARTVDDFIAARCPKVIAADPSDEIVHWLASMTVCGGVCVCVCVCVCLCLCGCDCGCDCGCVCVGVVVTAACVVLTVRWSCRGLHRWVWRLPSCLTVPPSSTREMSPPLQVRPAAIA